MAKIIIIGNSAAGFTCCDTLAKITRNNEITIISEEKFPFYRRDRLFDYIAGTVDEKSLFAAPGDYYSVEKIDFRSGQEVIKVDTKKQRVILKDNSKLSYDFLVIASGSKINLPDIPGTSKKGVISLSGLEEAMLIKEKLLIAGLICCVGKSNFCLNLTKVLLAKDKEVKAITSDLWPEEPEEGKLEVLSGIAPVEIIGEGSELKAVKLSNGKAIGTNLIIFGSDLVPSSDFLKDSGIHTENGYITVDQSMRTNLDNVFACGSVAVNKGDIGKEKDWIQSSKEGWVVANNLISVFERGEYTCRKS